MGVDAGRTGAGEKETSRTGTGENGTGGKDGTGKETGGEDGGATGDDTYGSEDVVAADVEEDVTVYHQDTDGSGYYEDQDTHTAPAGPGTSRLEVHDGLDDGPSGSLFAHDPLNPPDPDPGFDDDPDDPFDDLG